MADQSKQIQAAQSEFRKHYFGNFVDEPPNIAQGGKGVVVPGCAGCRKRFNTYSQFLDHLAEDVLPDIIGNALRSV